MDFNGVTSGRELQFHEPSLFILVFAVVNLSYQDHWPRFSGTLINLAEDVLGQVLLTRHARLWRRHIKCQRVKGSNRTKPLRKKNYSVLENYTEKVWKQKVLLTNSHFKKKPALQSFLHDFVKGTTASLAALRASSGFTWKNEFTTTPHPGGNQYDHGYKWYKIHQWHQWYIQLFPNQARCTVTNNT